MDLVDIDLDAIVDQGALVTLFDTGGLTRRYHVAEGFTEDIDVDGAPGYRTLDLRTLMPQMGFAAMATATEDAGFDATAVRTMLVELDSSGGVDNLSFNAALPAQKPAPGKTSSDGALLVGAKGVPAF